MATTNLNFSFRYSKEEGNLVDTTWTINVNNISFMDYNDGNIAVYDTEKKNYEWYRATLIEGTIKNSWDGGWLDNFSMVIFIKKSDTPIEEIIEKIFRKLCWNEYNWNSMREWLPTSFNGSFSCTLPKRYNNEFPSFFVPQCNY